MSKVIYITHEEHVVMIAQLRNQRWLGIKVRGGYQPRHTPRLEGVPWPPGVPLKWHLVYLVEMGFFSPICKRWRYLCGLVFYKALEDAPMGWASHITKLCKAWVTLRNLWRFWVLENISQKDASRFLEVLSVLSALAWESKNKDDAMERSVGFLMLLCQCSLQISLESFVQCILCYYILITICFYICIFALSSPFAFYVYFFWILITIYFCVYVFALSTITFLFLHFHQPFIFCNCVFAFSSRWPFAFVFLHSHHHLLCLCVFTLSSPSTFECIFYIFITICFCICIFTFSSLFIFEFCVFTI